MPSSRPSPLRLTPPKGDSRNTLRLEFTESTPVSMARATRSARFRSRVHKRAREAVDRVVREPDGLGLVPERQDRHHRTEDLFARDAHRGRHAVEHRRAQEGAAGERRILRHVAAAHQARALLAPDLEVALHALAVRARDQRADLGALIERIAHDERLRGRGERLDEGVVNARLDQDPTARAAILPGVAEDGEQRFLHAAREIGVGEDDARRLAAELERGALDVGGAEPEDLGAVRGIAGEGDLHDVRVRDQRRADAVARARHHARAPRAGARPAPASSARRSTESGVALAGFTTAVFPAASAGAIFQQAIRNGKFQGTISAQGPSGWRSVSERPGASTGGVDPASWVAAPA